jgi:hypothetical protein
MKISSVALTGDDNVRGVALKIVRQNVASMIGDVK